MSNAPSRRDVAVANEAIADRATMCSAAGCPNVWTVDRSGKLCSAHAWADPQTWPHVTQEQLDAEAQRALEASNRPPPVQQPLPSLERRRAVVQRMAELSSATVPAGRGWALSLKARDDAGEPLTIAQRQMYRDALRPRPGVSAEDDAA